VLSAVNITIITTAIISIQIIIKYTF
jgi:hypothetical protein